MGFLGDAQKLSAIVLPELDMEVFALDLELFRLNDVIHFFEPGWSLALPGKQMEEQFQTETSLGPSDFHCRLR